MCKCRWENRFFSLCSRFIKCLERGSLCTAFPSLSLLRLTLKSLSSRFCLEGGVCPALYNRPRGSVPPSLSLWSRPRSIIRSVQVTVSSQTGQPPPGQRDASSRLADRLSPRWWFRVSAVLSCPQAPPLLLY